MNEVFHQAQNRYLEQVGAEFDRLQDRIKDIGLKPGGVKGAVSMFIRGSQTAHRVFEATSQIVTRVVDGVPVQFMGQVPVIPGWMIDLPICSHIRSLTPERQGSEIAAHQRTHDLSSSTVR